MPEQWYSRWKSFRSGPGSPAPGSEWAGVRPWPSYPAEVEATYTPRSNDRFIKTIKKGGSTRWSFDWKRWERWLRSQGQDPWQNPDAEKFQEQRKVKTRLGSGWRYSSFCKSQYASDPACGGIPNFIRCHLSVIHLLDRIGQLPTVKVDVDDEVQVWLACITLTIPWAEKRVYTWHEGRYDVKALVEEGRRVERDDRCHFWSAQ